MDYSWWDSSFLLTVFNTEPKGGLGLPKAFGMETGKWNGLTFVPPGVTEGQLVELNLHQKLHLPVGPPLIFLFKDGILVHNIRTAIVNSKFLYFDACKNAKCQLRERKYTFNLKYSYKADLFSQMGKVQDFHNTAEQEWTKHQFVRSSSLHLDSIIIIYLDVPYYSIFTTSYFVLLFTFYLYCSKHIFVVF